jgi:hypothetical protein
MGANTSNIAFRRDLQNVPFIITMKVSLMERESQSMWHNDVYRTYQTYSDSLPFHFGVDM